MFSNCLVAVSREAKCLAFMSLGPHMIIFHTARGPGTTGFSRTFQKVQFQNGGQSEYSQSKNSDGNILFRENIDQ